MGGVVPRVQDTEKELSRCAQRLLMKEPFYGHLLARMARKVTEDTPTAAVTVRDGVVVLMINPGFFLEDTTQRRERVAVLKHELLHVVLRHVVRASAESRDPHVWNLATDLVVNQLVGAWPLPSDAVTLTTFADLELPTDATADRYYALLRKHASASEEHRRSRTERTLQRKTRWHSDHDPWVVGRPDEPEDDAQTGSGAVSSVHEAELADVLDAWVGSAAQKLSPAEHDALPGVVRGMIERSLGRQTSVLDWRRSLRVFVASSRRTRIDRTLRRPSRRFGTFPGIRVRRFARVAVVVDTSASIGEHELDQFFAEVHAIARQGAELMVLECDAEVQAVYGYRGRRPTLVHGGGGTLFDPALEYLVTSPGPWDACIYLTDGQAPGPTRQPPCPLLWVLSGTKPHDHLRVGRVVRLEARARARARPRPNRPAG